MLSFEAIDHETVFRKCEEWWELTKDQYALFEVYKIYKEEVTRKQIRKAIIYEAITVIFIANKCQQEMPPSMRQYLSSLIQTVYSLYLHMVSFVLQRMGSENWDRNVWASALNDILN